MPVETNQWRAKIGCFRSSVLKLFSLRKTVRPYSIIFQATKLLWFCYFLIAFSTLALPISIIVHFLAVHSMVTQLPFLPLLARMHHFAKSELYAFAELFKRIPFGVSVFVRKKYFHSQDAYYHTACIAYYMLYIQWAVFKINLLSGDIDTNPGPETLSFCCWNLNSITAYDFLRVSLNEANNSVYNNDLIGIVETYLDSTVDEDRLALDGYSFFKANHPWSVKRGGIGQYVKNSLPCKDRLDLASLPECIVSKIHLNRKKYFYFVIYRSPSQDLNEFDHFTMNFE